MPRWEPSRERYRCSLRLHALWHLTAAKQDRLTSQQRPCFLPCSRTDAYYTVTALGISIHLLLILSRTRVGRSTGSLFSAAVIPLALTFSFGTPTLLSKAAHRYVVLPCSRDKKPPETQTRKWQAQRSRRGPQPNSHLPPPTTRKQNKHSTNFLHTNPWPWSAVPS